MTFQNYTNKTADDALRSLRSSFSGLDEAAAARARATYGANELPAARFEAGRILVRQAKSAFFYMLVAAAVAAFFIGESISTFLILLFLAINAALAFYQEYRAEKAVHLLASFLSPKVVVLRQGKVATVDKRMLVPGDIAVLEAGTTVAADLRVVKEKNLCIDQSPLTGESLPVAKTSSPLYGGVCDMFRAANIAFAGTSVVSGSGLGMVIATGKNTAFGEAAKLAGGTRRKSSYEKHLADFSNLVYRGSLGLVAVTFLAHVALRGFAGIYDYFIFCVALAVGIVPEALPVVAIFGLSQGALYLTRHNVVVKRLSAIEDLGDIDILCTDKTGTLTENKLAVDCVAGERELLLKLAMLSSGFAKGQADAGKNPFDAAILKKCPKIIQAGVKQYQILCEAAFDPWRMRGSVLAKGPAGKKILVVKGAPEAVIGLCRSFPKGMKRQQVGQEIAAAGSQGRRALAVAYKPFRAASYTQADEQGLVFAGYITFHDPLKPTAKAAIELAGKLNVGVKILTGDSPEVAAAVAGEVGLMRDGDRAVTGRELEAMKPEEFAGACEAYRVFARVSPSVKCRIIEALEREHEVGFVGEGINDAPSLKIANVGLAVAEAADVSRQAADIVVLRRDLHIIVDGIRRGRNIFSNIQKYIKCTLAGNSGTGIFLASASLIAPFLPMLPIQILLCNLIGDFALIAIMTDSVEPEELRKPKSIQLGRIMPLAGLLAATSVGFGFLFFAVFSRANPPQFQTLWFAASLLAQVGLIFSIRSRRFMFKAKKPGLILSAIAFAAVLAALVLPFTGFGQALFKFVSLSPLPLLGTVALVALYVAAGEAVKLLYYRFFPNSIHLPVRKANNR